ncbi:MAG: hypothetical protein GY716_02305 [bacterium]|nr:hypothetical protein [bacterium]
MSVEIRNEIADRVRLTWFVLDGIVVREDSATLQAAIDERSSELRSRFDSPKQALEVLTPARRVYKSLGIDPSRRRPSSEALLRRVLQGKGLYRVNTAVDAANLASLSYLLPVGLYDADSIESATGEVDLRLGRAGEEYDGIGKGTIHVHDRPTLVDDCGPFGNPSSDSFRTRVTLETARLLFVVFAPADDPDCRVESYRAASIETLQRFVGGRV